MGGITKNAPCRSHCYYGKGKLCEETNTSDFDAWA